VTQACNNSTKSVGRISILRYPVLAQQWAETSNTAPQ